MPRKPAADWVKHYDRNELNKSEERRGVLANTLRTFSNVTLTAGESFAPAAAGWAVSAPTWTAIEVDLTLQAADLNDATLTITVNLEWTTDPTGASGWDILTGGGWVGGSRVRNGVTILPSYPAYTLSVATHGWPAGLASLRLHSLEARQVRRVDAEISSS
jgi:hypothetical protein